MSAVAIRPERPSDREAALEVHRSAFGSEDEAKIVAAVRDEEGSFGLVAEDDGEIIGHIQFSRAWIGATEVLALGPIGVRADRQREGNGSELIRAGVQEARSRGEAAVILLGDPAFYPRFGFEPGSSRGLRNPFAGVQPDGFEIAEEDFMLVVLDEAPLAGEVRWHPAFRLG
ncbi:MAG: N-acetyltransferase [Actinomycetota bacterium]